PMLNVRLKEFENSMRLDLNAVVLAFAMLLPITSRFREFALSPDRPVKSAVVDAMGVSPSVQVTVSRACVIQRAKRVTDWRRRTRRAAAVPPSRPAPHRRRRCG